MSDSGFVSLNYEKIPMRVGGLFQDDVQKLSSQNANALLLDLRKKIRHAEKEKNKQLAAKSYLQIAMVFRGQRSYGAALSMLHKAQSHIDHAVDRELLAALYEELACVNRELNRNTLALDYSQKAVHLYQELKKNLELGWAYDNMSVIYHNMARRHESLIFAKKAREIFLEHNNPSCLAWNSCNLGNINFDLGSYAEAKAYYLGALNIFQELGIKQGISWTLLWLGMSARAQTQFKEAEEFLEKAIVEFLALGIHDRAGWAVLNLAGIRWAQGRMNDALSLNQKAIKMFRSLSNNDGLAWGTFQIAQIFREQGRLTNAWRLLRQSQDLFNHIASQKGSGWVECELAEIYLALSDQTHAFESLKKSKIIADKLAFLPLKMEIDKNTALWHINQGQLDEALALLRSAEETTSKNQIVEIYADILLAKTKALLAKGDLDGVAAATKSLAEIIDTHQLGRLKPHLDLYQGEHAMLVGDIAKAENFFQSALDRSQKLEQLLCWAEASLGLLQTERITKSPKQRLQTLAGIEKRIRTAGCRCLKAKVLALEAILDAEAKNTVDPHLVGQCLRILEETNLHLLRKELLEFFVWLTKRTGQAEESEIYASELRSLIDTHNLGEIGPRERYFEIFPVSVIS